MTAVPASLAAVPPEAWMAALLGALLAALLLGGLLLAAILLRRRPRPAPAAQADVETTLATLQAGQERLAGALAQVADGAARAQAETARTLEARLDALGDRLGAGLTGAASRTAETLGALETRLAAIDRAQENIERLSGDVLGLQDILSNKQARGAFGEIQLADLISQALPPNAYALQAPLGEGRRVDALITLPRPPGPIAVDAKFPLEPYEALAAASGAGNDGPRKAAERAFRQAVRAHVSAIADRYIVPGETADGALMFVPSEAVYAELHARFAELVREGFEKRVFIVSPTTLMATLATMRAVMRDARLAEEADGLRRELGLLAADLGRLGTRVDQLGAHFAKAEKDVEAIRISAAKSLKRLGRLTEDGARVGEADEDRDGLGAAIPPPP